MADKKSGPTADDIMSPAEMKPLLAKSKHEPVSCAIGLTKGKDGIVFLDKKMKPKQLLAELKKKAVKVKLELDAPSLRFGRAHVDADLDSGLVQFVVNKDAGGAMRPKLLEHLKKAGFGKLEIMVDAGFEAEPDEAAEADASSPPPPLTTAQPAPPVGAGSSPAAPMPAQPAVPANGEGSPAAGPDPTALTKTLTELVRRMVPVIGTDPGRGASLKELATHAQASLKAGDLAGAAAGIEGLRWTLDGIAAQRAPATLDPSAQTTAPQPPLAPGGPAAPDVHTKSRLAWIATRAKVENELAKLKSGILAACGGHDIEAQLEDGFRQRVEPVLGSLDDSLAHKLDELNKATDAVQRPKLLSEAKQILQRYQSYITSEPIIAQLDANPFVPVAVQKTLMATLSTLSVTLR